MDYIPKQKKKMLKNKHENNYFVLLNIAVPNRVTEAMSALISSTLALKLSG